MEMQIPAQVAEIIDTLEKAGYEAYAVGGCVRDTILGREPGDWDITTSARPGQVKALFRRTVDTGIQHGTVTVMKGKTGYEVTTYRIDGEYEDGRHPNQVAFTANLTEDLKRRDFTINAMAYSRRTGIVDQFAGMEDLKNRIIRCVGNPEDRFEEDALRMLRAVRFSAQLGFSIEEDTRRAIRKMAPRLNMISSERIRTELDKLLCSPHPEYFREVYELGISAVVMPEFDRAMKTPQRNRYHDLTVGEHTLKTMAHIRPDPILRWTMLLHDLGKAEVMTEDGQGCLHFYDHASHSARIAGEILRRLKFDNATRHKVTELTAYHDFPFPISLKGVRKALSLMGEELFLLLLKVCTADSMGKNDYARAEYLPKLAEVKEYYKEITEAGDCVSLKTLAIKGSDLISAGMKPGKAIGDCLQKCLEQVLECPERNTKEYLMGYAEKIRKEQEKD